MRKKIVHVVTRLDYGGAQQNTLHTVEHLNPRRFEAVLICGRGGRLDARAEALARSERPVRTRFLDDLVREISPLRDLTAFLQLYRAFTEERPDVVHTHSSKAGILARFAALLAGVPVVLHTFHGFAFHEWMREFQRAFYTSLERAAAKFTTRLIFVSRANMEYARDRGIGEPRQYRLIRSGVRLTGLPAPLDDAGAKRASIGVPKNAPMLVSVGNLKPQKNCMDFLKVAEEVSRRMPDVRFVFVGDGPMRPEFEAKLRESDLADRVFLLGWRDDVREILAASDVFLLTSLWEGLPRALVEAMKSRLPCVAYAVDGVRDILTDASIGRAVPPGDWRQAADCVAELLEDRGLRKRLGAAAAASIGREFDIDDMVRRQEELYAELTA